MTTIVGRKEKDEVYWGFYERNTTNILLHVSTSENLAVEIEHFITSMKSYIKFDPTYEITSYYTISYDEEPTDNNVAEYETYEISYSKHGLVNIQIFHRNKMDFSSHPRIIAEYISQPISQYLFDEYIESLNLIKNRLRASHHKKKVSLPEVVV